MKIETHLVELENPFIPAQHAFEELVQELSGGETQKKTHSELENLINVRGIEVMRLLLKRHLEARGAGVFLILVVNNERSLLMNLTVKIVGNANIDSSYCIGLSAIHIG